MKVVVGLGGSKGGAIQNRMWAMWAPITGLLDNRMHLYSVLL